MILYLDTSALVKLCVAEPGSDAVAKAAGEAAAVATHLVAYAEMRAALAKAVRMGRLAPAALDRLVADFELIWASLDVVGVTEPLVRRAGDLTAQHGLRGYDGVHLAAALSLQELAGSGAKVGFGAFDLALRTAAATHGLAVFPPD